MIVRNVILGLILVYFYGYREELWTTFPRQEEAIRFLKAHAQAKLFSYQDHLSGQRRFLVSTYSEFWRRSHVIPTVLYTNGFLVSFSVSE